jgi:hypothetical protein
MAGKNAEVITVAAPKFKTVQLEIEGTSPYVQHKFSEKAKLQMIATQEGGDASRTKKKREPKDFDACYEQATHRMKNGECGIPAPAFRNAMISACRTVGIVMTRAKLCVFVEADGVDKDDGTPLVKIVGARKKHIAPARNDNGSIDIRARPMWDKWSAKIRIRFDESMIGIKDVVNLMVRVGMQVGIGEGRPDSRNSAGLGWGLFRIKNEKELA